MSKNVSYKSLVEEALDNAKSDREKVLEAYEDMKGALKIDSADDVQKTMLVGEKAVKLLDLLNKTNSQIIQLAQLEQKNGSKDRDEDDEEKERREMSEILEAIKSGEIKTRVEEAEEEVSPAPKKIYKKKVK